MVLESHGRGGRPRLGRFVNQNQNLVIKHGRREKGWPMPFWAILGKFLHLLDFGGGFSSACPRFPWTGRFSSVCRGGNRQAESSRLCTGNLQWPKTALLGQLIPGSAGAGASRASLPSGHDPYRASGKEEGTDGRQKLDRATPDEFFFFAQLPLSFFLWGFPFFWGKRRPLSRRSSRPPVDSPELDQYSPRAVSAGRRRNKPIAPHRALP